MGVEVVIVKVGSGVDLVNEETEKVDSGVAECRHLRLSLLA